MDSFRPLYSFSRSEDGWAEFGGRLVAFAFLCFLVYKLSQEPETLKEYTSMGTQSFDDIIEWGKLQIEGKKVNEGKRRRKDGIGRRRMEDKKERGGGGGRMRKSE